MSAQPFEKLTSSGDLRALLVEPQESRFRSRCGLNTARLDLVVSGYEKLIVLAPDRVFAFPRHHGIVPALEREAAVLASLAFDLAPALLAVHSDPAISPYPFLELTRLPGTSWDLVHETLSDAQVAVALTNLAHAIARLHETPFPHQLAAPPAHLEAQRVTPAWTDAERLPGTLASLVDRLPTSRSWPWTGGSLRSRPSRPWEGTTVHGEVSDGQFLVDDALHVTGIVDWAAAHVGHPLRDLDFGTDNHRMSMRPDVWREHRRQIWLAYAQTRTRPPPPWAAVNLWWSMLDLHSVLDAGSTDDIDVAIDDLDAATEQLV